MIKKVICIIFVFCLAISMATSAAAAGVSEAASQGLNFPDVSQTDWFYTYVSDLSKKSVINGYPDGTFKPLNLVRCSEALKLILSASGHGAQDAADNNWASGYLKLAVSKGLVNASDITDLNGTISRKLIAKIAANALGLDATSIKSPFADTSDQYVLSLYQSGIVEGSVLNGSLMYMPDSSISRSEISAVIWRIENLKSNPDSDPITDPDPSTDPGSIPGAEEEDHTSQIQYGSDWLDILNGVPVNSYNKNSFYTENGLMQYDSPNVRTQHGVDVSSFQGDIDWQQVKASGIDFAMIRLGFRGYGSSGTMNLDSYFERNIQGALAAGLQVGVYFFSQAITPQEAVEEADFVLSNIINYNVTYPVVFDWETISSNSARTNGVDTQTLVQCAQAFCSRVSGAGYIPSIYFNQSLGYLKYDLSQVLGNKFWLAQYTSAPTFYYDFQMWQYTSSGTVNGISGRVDMDISFEI